MNIQLTDLQMTKIKQDQYIRSTDGIQSVTKWHNIGKDSVILHCIVYTIISRLNHMSAQVICKSEHSAHILYSQ